MENELLQLKVNMLEQTIQLLLQKLSNLPVKGVPPLKPLPTEEVVAEAEVVAEEKPLPNEEGGAEPLFCPFDIADLISTIEQENYVDYNQYTYYNNTIDKEFINWEEYITDHIKRDYQIKLANGNIDPFLKECYDEGSIKAIYNKICSKIPQGSIKVIDISRNKATMYYDGEWLNQSKTIEKIEELIVLYQQSLYKLHHIYIGCCDKHKVDILGDTYLRYITNTFEGNINQKIRKSILSYFV